MGFWGANGHDGVWHVSLINSLSKATLNMPIFSGEIIKNYHIGFDLLLVTIHALTHIPAQVLYFQLVPPFLAITIGLLTHKLTRSSAAVFFVYFSGSLGWILGKGESAFWSQQAISTLINPPFALSLVLMLVGLINIQKRSHLSALVFALASFSKVYAGILILPALLFLVINRKYPITAFMLFIFVSSVLFFPLNKSSGSLLVFQPGWFLETMMGLSDRLNWTRFYSAMTNYRLADNWPKAILAYSVAFGIFLVGNLGTRVLAFAKLTKIKELSSQEITMWVVILLGIVAPMLFLQSGTPWNTIQFFYYSLFFSSIMAGQTIQTRSPLVWLTVAVMTIPTTLNSLKHYLPSRPPAMISNAELEALHFLKDLPSGVVLTPVVIPDPNAVAPRPLYLYESTAYVSAFSSQPVYVEDYVNLNITGYNWQARRDNVDSFFKQNDPNLARKFISENNIRYIYLPETAKTRPVLSASQLGGKGLFENSSASIWEVAKD
jgi:hypothetical protein